MPLIFSHTIADIQGRAESSLWLWHNPSRIDDVIKAKASAKTASELVQQIDALCQRKPRRDKLAGDPIWEKVWHHFTEVKKGQSFRSQMIKNEKVKDMSQGDKGKWV